jgi:hypothetical protein
MIIDPLAEAELIRAVLHEVQCRLVATLKQQRRQTRAVTEATRGRSLRRNLPAPFYFPGWLGSRLR